MSVHFADILNNKVRDFDCGEIDFRLLAKYKGLIKDSAYFEFIVESENGGFFFNQSLQVYSYSNSNDFNSIDLINSILKEEFGEIFGNLISFSQDLFGNQFCFDTTEKKIVFFSVEEGQIEQLAPDFYCWLQVLNNDFDFYVGENFLQVWQLNNPFYYNQRLCPKIPFIIGGDYQNSNLYAGTFPAFIGSYANLARQIYGLPNGTKVQLVIKWGNE